MARPPRDLSPDDRRIWARVTGSVTPPKSRKAPRVMLDMATPADPAVPLTPKTTPVAKPRPGSVPPSFTRAAAPSPQTPSRSIPEVLEPRRQRRLSRERDPIEARIDLHGYGRFQAQDALTAFLMGAQARDYRAVLVITGQGRRGGTGVIRASVHEWLQGPGLRGVVSGFAAAARRHGGDGAIYVTLKRRS
ncbi:Smr/MutS family protein [Brevundimonas variabilis]|uniref:DNA-nicking Smr family endonuclease n=1 Tax=Brevundimonas variabilis TaxID=74312 RepID=A0A7W9FDB5_9CAUL|nr:Smr/MutS family protein [Brevundimonas variabilis]MBB5745092.1 DNA-nicking Smr family endonuclease [Brevundimonas variabilis]